MLRILAWSQNTYSSSRRPIFTARGPADILAPLSTQAGTTYAYVRKSIPKLAHGTEAVNVGISLSLTECLQYTSTRELLKDGQFPVSLTPRASVWTRARTLIRHSVHAFFALHSHARPRWREATVMLGSILSMPGSSPNHHPALARVVGSIPYTGCYVRLAERSPLTASVWPDPCAGGV